jgi:hypothetical protein
MRQRFRKLLNYWPVFVRLMLGLVLASFMFHASYPGWLWQSKPFSWTLPEPVLGLFVCGLLFLLLIPIDILFRQRLSMANLLILFVIALIFVASSMPKLELERHVSSMSDPRRIGWSRGQTCQKAIE